MQSTTTTSQLPFYQHAGVVLDKCRASSIPLLLSAPTGSGKTLGIRKIMAENPKLFGKTLMVQPTKIASKIGHLHANADIVSMTPLQAIDACLRSRHHPLASFRTLIIDEVHTRTVEYYTLLSILHRKHMSAHHRIILMSATADPEYLDMFFHDFRTYDIPVASPFPIQILYREHHDYGFINTKGMLPIIKNILKEQPNHKRVLVFVYTHEQCDKLASDLVENTAAYNQGKTFALYGGMMPEDMEAWQKFLIENESFIVIATNVAETSITIPGLSLIIDFGIHCVQENNRIVYRDCSKSSLQQRAGRTGRTCAGLVVRCMSEYDYEDRPVQDDPELQWDLIVLRMLRFGANPADLLPHHVHIDQIVEKFVFYGLASKRNGALDHRKVQFVLSCPMSMRNSCMLYSFLSGPDATSHDKFLMFIIAIAVVDCCEARMIRIYYYKRDRNLSKQRFLDFIRNTFAGQIDELEIHINILFSCMFASNPVEFSNAFSLNFRSIRQLSASIHKVMTFASHHLGKTAPEWKTAVRTTALYGTHQRKDLSRKNMHDVCLCTSQAMDSVHTAFFMHMNTSCLMAYNDVMYRENFVTEFYNCMLSPYTSLYSTNHLIIPLGFDDTDITKWGDRTKGIQHPTIVSFSMYTLAPGCINDHIISIRSSIRRQHYVFSEFIKSKNRQVERFQPVLEDIQEDVAYRPGQWKMMDRLQQLMSPVLLMDLDMPDDSMDEEE